MTERLNYVTRNMTPDQVYNFLNWLMNHEREWVIEWLSQDVDLEEQQE